MALAAAILAVAWSRARAQHATTSSSTAASTATPTPTSTSPPTSTAGSTPTGSLSASPERLVAALRSKVALDPPLLDGDPYETWRGREPPRAPPGTVCAVRFEPDGIRYRLATYAGAAEAGAAGFAVTHLGACGTCSTLQDLAVYLERPDLTAPVRRCGIRPTASGAIACLERLGFSPACARTWYFNARNTRRECLGVCVRAWVYDEPSTHPDGRLNDCLRCDEVRSGPVFKAVAGRTRRNSGIRSSIPRPEEEVAHVVHDYVPEGPPAAGASSGGSQHADPATR